MIRRLENYSYQIKKPNLLVLIILILLLFGCKQELTEMEIFTKDGLVFSKQTKQLFTGVVLGSGYDGYRTQKCTFKKEFKEGKLHGTSYYWYPNGALESIESYKNGKLNGMVTRYYPNGKRKAKIHMVDGMRGGNQGELFWDKNGKLI